MDLVITAGDCITSINGLLNSCSSRYAVFVPHFKTNRCQKQSKITIYIWSRGLKNPRNALKFLEWMSEFDRSTENQRNLRTRVLHRPFWKRKMNVSYFTCVSHSLDTISRLRNYPLYSLYHSVFVPKILVSWSISQCIWYSKSVVPVQIMVWLWTGCKPLLDPVMTQYNGVIWRH